MCTAVINPPRDSHVATRRLSLVFFTGPDPQSEISCLPTCQSAEYPARYPPILVTDHVNEKQRLADPYEKEKLAQS